MKVTAKMIAKELGISTATVDRVLNNRSGVSEKTIRRVKEKAAELGYRPNAAAKYLATQKSMDVAFVLPVIPCYFWDELEREIISSARLYEDFGLKVQIFRVDAIPKENQINFIKNMLDQNIFDAFVISPHDADPYVEIINEGIRKGIPIFTLNNDVPNSSRISFVGTDYYSAGYLAAELIQSFTKDLRNVVIIREDENTYQMMNKEKGFRDYFAKCKRKMNIQTIPIMSDNIQLSEEWKSKMLHGCDAIYVANGVLGEMADYIDDKNYENNKIVIGHDMSKKVHHYLQNDVIKSVICQDPSSQARWTVQKVFEYVVLEDRSEQSDTIIKLEIVTKANAKYYINY
ncbi:LacI family DNA-binding transcriptional regulator [Bacillus sp. USDA818B3_A]|uniref:LacI family DNA-binding transcriptional regulator n=1 Tax=Bacillus sp. USDA818B3_A TaxID=2698834 RepID=UPI00136E7277|nr:LacI family DNA-binding transcriptional regulator [Bacillus sp. USDA818B3_A]